MRKRRPENPFIFIGNQTCLDFINTQMIQQGRLVDLLEDFSALMSWMVQARILDVGDAKEAIHKWGGRREGLRTFARAGAARDLA